MITMAARKRKTASIWQGMRSCAFWAGIYWPKAGKGMRGRAFARFFFGV